MSPNPAFDRTGQQRRCACCGLPSSLRSSAAAQRERWTDQWRCCTNDAQAAIFEHGRALIARPYLAFDRRGALPRQRVTRR